jgi:hypothetical protein
MLLLCRCRRGCLVEDLHNGKVRQNLRATAYAFLQQLESRLSLRIVVLVTVFCTLRLLSC